MDYAFGILISFLLTCILAYVEIIHESGKSGKALLCPETFAYLLVLALGNGISTLAAPSILAASNLISQIQGPVWLWYGVIGVFGFNAIIRYINITLFDQGVLSINEWVSKSKENATAAVIEKSVDLEHAEAQQIAQQLKNLPEDELDAQISQVLGSDTLEELNSQSGNRVNSRLLKALVLAQEETPQARAIVSIDTET